MAAIGVKFRPSVVQVNRFGIEAVMNEDVGAYASRMGRRIVKVAEGIAPRGVSGELARSHRFRGALREGNLRIATRVENTAPYALFVHDGTTGPIRSNKGRMLGPFARPRSGRYYSRYRTRGGFGLTVSPTSYHRSVRGQRAQPWLREAGETVAFTEANFRLV